MYSGCVSPTTPLPSIVAAMGMPAPSASSQAQVLQAEAVDLDAQQQHRLAGIFDPLGGLLDGFVESPRIAGRNRLCVGRPRLRPHVDHVAGDFDVHGPLEPLARGEHAVDLAKRGERIVKLRAGDAQLFEHVVLRAKVAHHVVQQRIVDPLAQARRAGDHHHRRLLGVGAGDGVANAQPADAVRDAQGAHAVDAGVGVGGEARAVLARAADDVERALLEHRVERQHVVAGNAEHVGDAVVLQPLDQVFAD